jgi:hypothetical protein
MKLDCGPTKKTKERLKFEKLSNWHTKFAWLPIRVGDNDCRWLEHYERKGKFERFPEYAPVFSDGYWSWEYKFKGSEDVVQL